MELNQFDVDVKEGEEDIILRMFRVAKSCGCKFHLGSDARHPYEFKDSKRIFERAAELLNLKEDDKFHIG